MKFRKCLNDKGGQRRMVGLVWADWKSTTVQAWGAKKREKKHLRSHWTRRWIGINSKKIYINKQKLNRLHVCQPGTGVWGYTIWALAHLNWLESIDQACLVSAFKTCGGGVTVWGVFSWYTSSLLMPLSSIVYMSLSMSGFLKVWRRIMPGGVQATFGSIRKAGHKPRRGTDSHQSR